MVLARKRLERPLVGCATRLFAKEIKQTLWPSALMEGATLEPFAGGGSVPEASLAKMVAAAQVVATDTQVFRTKIFFTPFAVFALRLEAREAKAMMGAEPFVAASFMLGRSLAPFPGMVPFEVERRTGAVLQPVVTPVQVSRT